MKTTRMNWRRGIACFLLLGLPAAAQAGLLGFLRLEGVTGESSDTNHVGWLEVESVQTANLRNVSGTNQPVSGSLCFQRRTDKASPLLLLDSASGTKINSGTLDMTGTNFSQMEFFRLNLTNVVVTSVTQNGQFGDASRPMEEVCLSPQILSWNYVQFSPSRGLPVRYRGSTWSLDNNTGGVSTNVPTFMSTGIRKPGGVELAWTAAAGKNYRIYAVPNLSQPFVPVLQMTATSSGPTNYTVAAAGAAMFFVIEEIPAGY